jgi:hypothetical protein
MKKTIDKVVCDTDTAKHLGFKYIGAFGTPDGYEEQSFVTEKGSTLYTARAVLTALIKSLTSNCLLTSKQSNG